jgi:hypothetical protein
MTNNEFDKKLSDKIKLHGIKVKLDKANITYINDCMSCSVFESGNIYYLCHAFEPVGGKKGGVGFFTTEELIKKRIFYVFNDKYYFTPFDEWDKVFWVG